MDAINEDIIYLNSELLLLASDAEEGERILRLLGAHPNVIARIAVAGSNAVGTAIRCGVPLITFNDRLDELLTAPLADVRGKLSQPIPIPLRELTRIALHIAQRVALTDRTVAQLHFGLTHRACDGLMNLSIPRLLRLGDRHGVLLRLRTPERFHVWERLLIGDRCVGPQGLRISHQAAMLSLGSD